MSRLATVITITAKSVPNQSSSPLYLSHLIQRRNQRSTSNAASESITARYTSTETEELHRLLHLREPGKSGELLNRIVSQPTTAALVWGQLSAQQPALTWGSYVLVPRTPKRNAMVSAEDFRDYETGPSYAFVATVDDIALTVMESVLRYIATERSGEEGRGRGPSNSGVCSSKVLMPFGTGDVCVSFNYIVLSGLYEMVATWNSAKMDRLQGTTPPWRIAIEVHPLRASQRSHYEGGCKGGQPRVGGRLLDQGVLLRRPENDG